jgi:hypothetical protein
MDGKKIELPKHLALHAGVPPTLQLKCAPKKLSRVVEIMLRFGQATTNPQLVTCTACVPLSS